MGRLRPEIRNIRPSCDWEEAFLWNLQKKYFSCSKINFGAFLGILEVSYIREISMRPRFLVFFQGSQSHRIKIASHRGPFLRIASQKNSIATFGDNRIAIAEF